MWSWKLLRAGSLGLDGGSMFGVVPKTIWSRLVVPDENNRIPLQTNCLLLDNGTTILEISLQVNRIAKSIRSFSPSLNDA